MVIEVSRTQDEEVGDGTTTAVVLVGSLMEQAEILLNKKIHPTVICRGYRMGIRITSYNVCYTKLLRDTAAMRPGYRLKIFRSYHL